MLEDIRTPKEIISLKLRLIFYPFIFISTAFVLVFTFLHWQFFLIHPGNVNEEVLDIWLPIILSWIPVLIWLRPRIHLIDLKNKKGNLAVLVYMIAGFTIAGTTIGAQKYIETATGKLTALKSIKDINAFEATKYYSLETHYTDNKNICFKNSSKVSGKHNNRLTFYIYIACPIYDAAPAADRSTDTGNETVVIGYGDVKADTFKNVTDSILVKVEAGDTINEPDVSIFKPGAILPKAWLCFEYEKEISNKLSKVEEGSKWHAFYKNTYENFYSKDLDSFVYLERLGNNKTRSEYRKALTNCNALQNVDSEIMLVPENKPFGERNGSTLTWTFVGFGIGAILFLVLILSRKFNDDRLRKFLNVY